MSWRETLGVVPSKNTSYTHNSQNTQNCPSRGGSAYCAYSAYRDSEQKHTNLLKTLGDVCRGLGITPSEVERALAPEDIEDWSKGEISLHNLAAFAHSLVQRREMDRGTRPTHYTEKATCKHCGPVWLWFSGEILGCPWCWNRVSGKPIPRP